eukprot:TRINITY_DN110678_c0_g1_i1.p1 TRINITY_DN110678_c0_g1~~TRINITY_DN110678_c0_g1_i1.p1  ORF type:complete len:399 (-),score=93.63 TRINITY_DN110678_c0_g1_i1:142-1338(-)
MMVLRQRKALGLFVAQASVLVVQSAAVDSEVDTCATASDEALCRAASAAADLSEDADSRAQNVMLLQSRSARRQASGLETEEAEGKEMELEGELVCEDTPGWMNGYNCRGQGYGEEDGCGELGWYCSGYEKQEWCAGGMPVEGKEYAFGKYMRNPVSNCCACGKAHQTCREFGGCNGEYRPSQPCQCTRSCQKYANCCADKAWTCDHQGLPPPTAPPPTPPPPTPAPITGKLCARENGQCACPSGGKVYYTLGKYSDINSAIRDKHAYTAADPSGKTPCTNERLGDPAPREAKACWCEESDFTPPAPLPSPRPPPVPTPVSPPAPSPGGYGPPVPSPSGGGPPAPSPGGGPPSPAPGGGGAPAPSGGAAACSAHSGCAALGLQGDCCPATNGAMLGCC